MTNSEVTWRKMEMAYEWHAKSKRIFVNLAMWFVREAFAVLILGAAGGTFYGCYALRDWAKSGSSLPEAVLYLYLLGFGTYLLGFGLCLLIYPNQSDDMSQSCFFWGVLFVCALVAILAVCAAIFLLMAVISLVTAHPWCSLIGVMLLGGLSYACKVYHQQG